MQRLIRLLVTPQGLGRPLLTAFYLVGCTALAFDAARRPARLPALPFALALWRLLCELARAVFDIRDALDRQHGKTADPKTTDHRPWIAAACLCTLLLAACRPPREEGTPRPAELFTPGTTELHRAVLENRLTDIPAAASPDTLNRPDAHGMTPLHLAAMLGNPDAVACLLALGADPHARDRLGHTPAAWARFTRHPELARLIETGPLPEQPCPQHGNPTPPPPPPPPAETTRKPDPAETLRRLQTLLQTVKNEKQ